MRPLSRAALCALALITAVIASLVPVSFDGVNLRENRSYAAVADPVELIEEMAAVSGLTAENFVATITGSIAGATGMIIATETGVKMGQSLGVNLKNLINTADYPDWDTLDLETQGIYGSRENYDAAKFNSLMAAFSLGGVVDGWYQSGGGNFNPDDDALERLQQIGRIGARWVEGGYNTVSELASLITNRQEVYNWVGADTADFNAEGVDGWPSRLPTSLSLGVGDLFIYAKNTYRIHRLTSSNVYWLNVAYRDSSGYVILATWAFSERMFYFTSNAGTNVDIPQNPTLTATQKQYGNHTYYVYGKDINSGYTGSNLNLADVKAFSNMPVVVLSDTTSNTQAQNAIEAAIPRILFGNLQLYEPYIIIGYPEEGVNDGDTPVYMPEDGVKPGQSWNVYITAPEVRPENPYNPDDLTGTPEWRQETQQNLTPLLGVHLDKLFPFCLVYDMQLLWDKFSGSIYDEGGGLRTQAVEDYTKIVIPVDYDARIIGVTIDEEITINLVPLRDLLQITRPFVFFLLMFALISAIVNFWKRILTGA